MAKRASGSNASYTIQMESEFGVTPADTGTALRLRGLTAGESLNITHEMLKSMEIDGKLGTKNGRTGSKTIAGSIPLEFSATDLCQELMVYACLGELTQTSVTWNTKPKFKKIYKRKTNDKSLTFEKQFNDVMEFVKFSGVKVNSMQLSVAATGSLATLSFDLMGKNGETSKVSYAPTPVNLPHTTLAGKDGLRIMVNEIARCASQLDLSVTNDLSEQRCIGSDMVSGFGNDLGSVTGSYQGFFENNDEQQEVLESTIFDIEFRFYNTEDNYVSVQLPSVQYDGTTSSIPNIDSSTTLTPTITFTGNSDDVEGTDIIFEYVNDNDVVAFLAGSGNFPVTDINLNSSSGSVNVGQTSQILANVSPSNATNKNITYTSTNSLIATVSATGLVTGVAVGSTTIKVSSQENPQIFKNYTITVTSGVPNVPVSDLTITPNATTINVGSTSQINATILPSNATNKGVTYLSANPTIASVNSSGLVTAVDVGEISIKVSSTENANIYKYYDVIVKKSDGVIPATAIDLDPSSGIVEVGKTLQINASVAPSNATKKGIKYITLDPNIATVVSDTGLVTGVGVGNVGIRAGWAGSEEGNDIFKLFKLSVVSQGNIPVSSVNASPNPINMYTNEQVQITPKVLPENATNKNVTYTVLNNQLAFTDAQGIVHSFQDAGTTTVTVASQQDPTKNYVIDLIITGAPHINVESVSFNEPTAEIAINEIYDVYQNTTVLPANATIPFCSYTSSKPSIVSVSESGDVQGVATGTATITVTSYENSSLNATMEITVTTEVVPKPVTSINIDPQNGTVNVGETIQVNATALPANAEDKSLNYETQDPTIATVNSTGLVTGVLAGSTVIIVKSVSNPSVSYGYTLNVV